MQAMHISRIDLNLLVVLETIYAEGSITKAANRLHLSQSAISHALSRLRDLLDDPLFEWHGKKMVPTPLARRVIGPLRESLTQIGALLNDVQIFDPAAITRRFVIGLRDLTEMTIAPPLMRALSAEAPNIAVSAVRVERRRMESELASGALDLAVDMRLPVSEHVMFARLRTDAIVTVARSGHPAVKQGKIDIDSYLAQKHVLVTSRRTGGGFEDFELERMGLKRRIALRCQSHFAACRAVSQTDLLLTMHENHAETVNREFGNLVLPFPVPLPPSETYVYWHTSMNDDPANRWLRDLILGACRD
ncbi:MAG TPA: LysR family transcriptional regulator [Parvibaculum sp.]